MTKGHADMLRDPQVRRAFEEELIVGEAIDTVAGMLESVGISQVELARRLGVSRSRVSQILSGAENLTLRSLGALGWALGVRFELTPAPMAERGGTPAAGDSPAPAWLAGLRRQPTPSMVLRDVRLPPAGTVAVERPVLEVVGGTLRRARAA